MLTLDKDEDKDIVFIHDERPTKKERIYVLYSFMSIFFIELLSTTKRMCLMCFFSGLSIVLSLYIFGSYTHTRTEEHSYIYIRVSE